jgi:hypothetical protein
MSTTPVYRKPGAKPPYEERMLITNGRVLQDYTWKWFSADKQSRSKEKRSTHKTDADAESKLAAAVAALVAAGWKPVANWPGKTTKPQAAFIEPDWWKKEQAKKAKEKTTSSKKPKRVTLGQLKVSGRAAKVPEAELAALAKKVTLPADWSKLLHTHGRRMFANLVRITKPENVLAETKRWVTFWTVDHEPVWTNFAELVPDPKRLVLVASSSNGDIVGYTGERYVVFPRGDVLAVGLADLAEVFGWFMDYIEEAEGKRPRPTYRPES